jgi:DMSO/TMAO reductase YedYZ molybdopterin-dependent catalytic subunit
VHVGADADAQVHPTIMPHAVEAADPVRRRGGVSGSHGTSGPARPPMRHDGPVKRDRTAAYLALAGILTGAAGILTSQATAWALGATNAPVSAVASAVRDLTPGPLAARLVHLVGHLDKPLLIAGTLIVLLVICAATGLLSRRHPLLPDVVFFLLALVGLASVLRLQDSGLASGLAVVVGLVTWIVVLRFLTAPLLARGAEPSVAGEAEPASTRRAFLLRAGATTAVVAFAGVAARYAGRGRRRVEQARKLLRLPVHRGVVPAGADVGVPGIPPWRTPNDRFYLIHTALSAPSISPGDWQLRIHGLVDRERTYSYDDLVGRQLTEAWVTLCCVSNEVGGDLIGNAYWSGVLVRELLQEAGVQADADAVLQTSHDGWTCGTPLAALTDGRNAMLALAMNGSPLPVDHGFPVRTVVPGLYGYVSATKWLVDLEVTRFDRFDAYWTRRGWSELGPVKTQSRIDVPGNGSDVQAGTIRVGGSAWAQHTGIAGVEFQLDGGPWQRADLGGVPDLDTWVQWTGLVQVSPGRHQLVVRATDRSGRTQTSVRTDVVPNGASGWHTISFNAR